MHFETTEVKYKLANRLFHCILAMVKMPLKIKTVCQLGFYSVFIRAHFKRQKCCIICLLEIVNSRFFLNGLFEILLDKYYSL